MKPSTYLTIIMIFELCCTLLFAQQPNRKQRSDHYVTISTIRARSHGVGGAYTAVGDGISSALFNPAALQLKNDTESSRFTISINPIGAIIGGYGLHDLTSDSTLTSTDIVAAAGLFIKSISMSWTAFEVTLILSEALPPLDLDSSSKRFFNSDGILDRYSNILASKIKLANQISIGASVSFYSMLTTEGRDYSYGSCYGVFVRPNDKVNIGLAYFDSPAKVSALKTQLDRIVDETVNMGISYRPFVSTLFSLDVRNVSEDQRTINREVHFGMEVVPHRHVAFRSGFYRKKLDKENVYSLGIGFLNSSLTTKSRTNQKSSDWLLNYTLEYDDQVGRYETYHYLSLLIQL